MLDPFGADQGPDQQAEGGGLSTSGTTTPSRTNPDYTRYPTAADVFALFVAANILPKAGMTCAQIEDDGLVNFTAAIDSAVDRWEAETYYAPFLAGNAETREFDVPRGVSSAPSLSINLNGGIIPGSVSSVSVDVLSGSSPVELTAGTQYRLWPSDAAQRRKPATYLEFRRGCDWFSSGFAIADGFNSGQRVVSVTARFGYCSTLPADVWEAIRRDAACMVAPEISYAISGGLISWTDDGVTERYSEDRLAGLVSGWSEYRIRTLTRGDYKRLAMA